MAKNKLLVLIGKPGVGKTTLAKEAFPDQVFVDVLPFIEKFRLPDGRVEEEKLILAYEKMYRHLEKMAHEFVVLEIGTGFPESNILSLEKMLQRYEISIYLCIASEATHWKRAYERGMRHNTEAFKSRMARDFPNEHEKLLAKTSLSYSILNMEQSLENLIRIVSKT